MKTSRFSLTMGIGLLFGLGSISCSSGGSKFDEELEVSSEEEYPGDAAKQVEAPVGDAVKSEDEALAAEPVAALEDKDPIQDAPAVAAEEKPAEAGSEFSQIIDQVSAPPSEEEKVEAVAEQESQPAVEAVAEVPKQDVNVAEIKEDDSVGETAPAIPVAEETSSDSEDSSLAPKALKKKQREYRQVAEVGAGQRVYIVQPGDTLGKIADQIYGSTARWPQLAQANGLDDPNRLFPGDKITYEDSDGTKAFSARYEQKDKQEVEVQRGDSLYSIAARVYGSGEAWKVLYAFNEEILSNPNKLEVGQKLSYLTQSQMTH